MTTDADPRAATIVLPPQPPRAFAIYAVRLPNAATDAPASALPAALAAAGFTVLTLDLGPAEPAPDGDRDDERTAAEVCAAAAARHAEHGAPALLIGHSGAGPAVLAAAATLSGVRAVVTIASPAPRSPRPVGVPLLVLHAPRDPVVPVDEAGRVFAAARHPKSFIALDGNDHAISEPQQARHVAELVAAWAAPYLPGPVEPPSPGPVVVTDAGTGRYTQRITAGRHLLTVDEPPSVGGADAGPTPYDLLLGALGACTSMTLRMYADRKGLPLRRTTVRLQHDRIHAEDCETCEQRGAGLLPRIRREITLEGPLTEQDRRLLIEIADRCPVHRTLNSEIVFETAEEGPVTTG